MSLFSSRPSVGGRSRQFTVIFLGTASGWRVGIFQGPIRYTLDVFVRTRQVQEQCDLPVVRDSISVSHGVIIANLRSDRCCVFWVGLSVYNLCDLKGFKSTVIMVPY